MRFKDKTDLWKRHSDVPQPIKNAKRLFQVRGKFFTQSRTRSDFSTGGKSVLSNQERETIFSTSGKSVLSNQERETIFSTSGKSVLPNQERETIFSTSEKSVLLNRNVKQSG